MKNNDTIKRQLAEAQGNYNEVIKALECIAMGDVQKNEILESSTAIRKYAQETLNKIKGE